MRVVVAERGCIIGKAVEGGDVYWVSRGGGGWSLHIPG